MAREERDMSISICVFAVVLLWRECSTQREETGEKRKFFCFAVLQDQRKSKKSGEII